MYRCLKCGNKSVFEEINVIKTYVKLNHAGEIEETSDKFFYLENVICLECNSTKDNGDIE